MTHDDELGRSESDIRYISRWPRRLRTGAERMGSVGQRLMEARELKNALDGRRQRNTTTAQAISQPMTSSSLASPMPGRELPSRAMVLSVWMANSTVPVTRAQLLPFLHARAIQSQTAISIRDTSTTRPATPAERTWAGGMPEAG